MRNISMQQAREGARIVEVRDDVPHFLLTLVVEGPRARNPGGCPGRISVRRRCAA